MPFWIDWAPLSWPWLVKWHGQLLQQTRQFSKWSIYSLVLYLAAYFPSLANQKFTYTANYLMRWLHLPRRPPSRLFSSSSWHRHASRLVLLCRPWYQRWCGICSWGTRPGPHGHHPASSWWWPQTCRLWWGRHQVVGARHSCLLHCLSRGKCGCWQKRCCSCFMWSGGVNLIIPKSCLKAPGRCSQKLTFLLPVVSRHLVHLQ